MISLLSVPELVGACSYRRPMLVREVMMFRMRLDCYGYYVCPRCHITMEREFVKYCDRCGQCLDWSRYEQAEVVYPGRKQ